MLNLVGLAFQKTRAEHHHRPPHQPAAVAWSAAGGGTGGRGAPRGEHGDALAPLQRALAEREALGPRAHLAGWEKATASAFSTTILAPYILLKISTSFGSVASAASLLRWAAVAISRYELAVTARSPGLSPQHYTFGIIWLQNIDFD